MLKRWIVVCGLISAAVVQAEEPEILSESDMLRNTLAAVQNNSRSSQIAHLSVRMSRKLNDTLRLHSDELARMSVAADCIRYLRLTEPVWLKPETEQWLLADSDRLHLLTDSILPTDNLKLCFQGLENLLDHDPDGRDKYFKLMLALNVVWDQPERPLLHFQMGEKTMPYKPDLPARYDYFKELYASGDAKIPYEKLGVRDLVFVVDTPVPLSELQWVRENVKGSQDGWGEKFSDIIYDTSRISASQYQWPYGLYTLESIRRKGGICVDQAYYATMTARAFGIPAMCFGAAGKSGSHEWFSYMNQPGSWALNTGRYEEEEYTTGRTINPQTNEKITDHDIVYASGRTQDEDRMTQSDVYTAVAETLVDDPDNVLRCINQARKIDPQNLKAWQIEIDTLIADDDCRGLLDLVEDLQDAFEEHPDIVVDSAEKIVSVLKENGMEEEADHLHRQVSRRVDDDRDDLARFLGMDEIEALVKEGNIKKARREMEDLLEEHMEDGRKTFAMIDWYLRITKDTDQAKAAAKFLEEYIEEMLDSFDFSSAYREFSLEFLLQAYEQAGDEKGIEETKVRIEDI